ncbi:hypothetical protein Tco_1268793 [Tanacetum coccineum]
MGRPRIYQSCTTHERVLCPLVRVDIGIMEIEPDFENMTINEYLEYEAEMERQLRRNVHSKRSPTKYEKSDFDSFHRNRSNTFNYPYSYGLPHPHPCFLLVQPYPEGCLVSANVSDDVDIESMTIAEYNLYVAKRGLEKNLLNNHSYGFTPQFFAQPPHTSNTSMDKKDSNFDEILDDLDTNHENEEAQVEDGEEGDIYNIWDITIEDIERIRQFLTPNVPDVMGDVIQPLIPKTIHTTPPDKKYVAPATKPTLNDLLEEFGDEILNVTIVDEEVDFNPTKDIEELERLLAKDPQSCFTEIRVHSVIIKPNEEFEPSIHTRPLNPLHRIFES